MLLMSIPGISAIGEAASAIEQTNPLATRKAVASDKVDKRAARR